MEVNESRNCPENQMNVFENGKTQLFNSGGIVKWAYFQKKFLFFLREDPQVSALLNCWQASY